MTIGVFGVLLATIAFEPASVFTDHAVLLRSKDTPVFGYAEPGEKVDVSIGGASASSRAGADGKWLVRLDLSKTGDGPFDLRMNGTVARDVLVGEVWLCSGQSNMSFGMTTADDVETERKLTNGFVRCYITHGWMSATPKNHVTGHWMRHMDESPSAWTAVGYHFAKPLAEKLKRPIGIVNASVGASSIEAWIDPVSFAGAPAAARAAFEASQKEYRDYPAYERGCMEARKAWAREHGRGDRPHALGDAEKLDWKPLSKDGLYGLFRRGGAFWFRRKVKLSKPGEAHEIAYARFVERVWCFNLSDAEVYWNGRQLAERQSANALDVLTLCYDVPKGDALAENTLMVRVYDCDWSRQLPYAFMLDGKRLSEDGWELADEFTLPPIVGEAAKTLPKRPIHFLQMNVPGSLYNGEIASLVPMGLSGVVWYQGESNARKAKEYYDLFPAFIEHWRTLFQKPSLPFCWCQLAAYDAKVVNPNFPRAPRMAADSDWPMLRDAQDKTLSLPMTGQAILLDAGEEQDIHPRDKRTPGTRLAAWALNRVYGFADIPYAGPRPVSATAEGGAVRVAYSDATGGLSAHDLGKTYIVCSKRNETGTVKRNSPNATVEGFSVAGPDGVWHWADEATVEGTSVKVAAKAVADPKAIRYGWAQNPWVNLYNGAGFPAVPFEMKVTRR